MLRSNSKQSHRRKLVKISGGLEARGSEAKPPEAESILVIGCPTEPANLAPLQKCLALQGMNGLTVDLSALRKNQCEQLKHN